MGPTHKYTRTQYTQHCRKLPPPSSHPRFTSFRRAGPEPPSQSLLLSLPRADRLRVATVHLARSSSVAAASRHHLGDSPCTAVRFCREPRQPHYAGFRDVAVVGTHLPSSHLCLTLLCGRWFWPSSLCMMRTLPLRCRMEPSLASTAAIGSPV